MMTHRERMLAAFKGEAVDQIPFAPRMDLWFLANKTRGTLPKEFEEAKDAIDVAKILDVGFYAAMGADYTVERDPKQHFLFNGFGIDSYDSYPYSVKISKNIPTKFDCDDKGNYSSTFETSVGVIKTHSIVTEDMKKNGISLPFTKEYPIKSVDDLEAMGEIWENLEIVPTPEGYNAFREQIGDQGLAVAYGMHAASPLHCMLHDMMPYDLFFYLWFTERDALNKLAKRMQPAFDKMLDAVLETDAEVVYWGSNYDSDITWPDFFEADIIPNLQKVSKRIHNAGKLLTTHCDGENRALLKYYDSCGFDIAESVCPAPMTKCTLTEIRQSLPKGAVWGGIPSVAMMDDSMKEAEFDKYLDEVFSELGTGERLVFGVSDNVPPELNMGRFEKLRQKIEAFGPVKSLINDYKKD